MALWDAPPGKGSVLRLSLQRFVDPFPAEEVSDLCEVRHRLYPLTCLHCEDDAPP